RSLGRHVLAEFYGCCAEVLDDPGQVERHMKEAAAASGATLIQSVVHHFSPHGVSGVVVVAESHLAVHTRPEHHLAAVEHLRRGLRADRVVVREVPWGILAPAEGEGRREPLAAPLLPSLPW
ncbi:MAG: adenosylmethionine decarboxylase, partial [Nitrospinota bacterium]